MSRAATSAVLALCAIASPCLATTAASASLTNLTFTLVDLSPSDGIAPAIQFISPGTYGSTVVVTVNDYAGLYDARGASGLEQFGPASASVSMGPNWAAGRIGEGSAPGAISLSASGSATKVSAAGLRSEFTAEVSAPGPAFFSGNFTLTPNTSVTFAAIAQASVATSGGNGYQYAIASVTMDLSFPAGGPQHTSAGLYLEQDSTLDNGTYIGGAMQASESFSTTYVNDTNDIGLGQFYVGTRVWGFTSATVVPEPASLALMGLGLGCLALAARRAGRASGD